MSIATQHENENFCQSCKEKLLLQRVIMQDGEVVVTFEQIMIESNSQPDPYMNLQLSMECFDQNLERFKTWRDTVVGIPLTPHELHFVMQNV